MCLDETPAKRYRRENCIVPSGQTSDQFNLVLVQDCCVLRVVAVNPQVAFDPRCSGVNLREMVPEAATNAASLQVPCSGFWRTSTPRILLQDHSD